MKKLFLILLLTFNVLTITKSQTFDLGGSQNDAGRGLLLLGSNTYLLNASTKSFGEGQEDILLVKMFWGNTIFAKTYGTANKNEFLRNIIKTADGGYAGVGTSGSGSTEEDLLFVKWKPNLDLDFAKLYGTNTTLERGFDLLEKPDGSIILGGSTTHGMGARDVYLLNIDATGTVLWSNVFGTTLDNSCFDMEFAANGNIMITGTYYNTKPKKPEILFAEIDATNGNLITAKLIVGNEEDHARTLVKTPTNEWYVVGHTTSFGAGGFDVFIAKLNSSGYIIWARAIGGNHDDFVESITLDKENNLLLSGRTATCTSGSYSDFFDLFLLRVASYGTIINSRHLGSNGDDNLPFSSKNSILAISSTGFIYTGSLGNGNFGNSDILYAHENWISPSCISAPCDFLVSDVIIPTSNIKPTTTTLNISSDVSLIANDLVLQKKDLCALPIPAEKNTNKTWHLTNQIVNNVLEVSGKYDTPAINYTIINAYGATVQQAINASFNINITQLANGYYWIELLDTNGKTVLPFIKQ